MKRTIAIFLTLSTILFVSTCSRNYTNPFKDVSIESVVKISIHTLPELFSAVELSEIDEVNKLVHYLAELNIGKVFDPEPIGGMAYTIDILYIDGTISKIILFGNSYIIVDDKSYELSYDEAAAFGTVIGEILLSRYQDDYDGMMIVGSVLSVESDSSGRSVAATIQISKEKEVSVDLSAVSGQILDISGSGWLILHIGDEVAIGLNADFTADKVFITKAAW